MFSAVGPERAVQGHALELTLDQAHVEVEERQAPELAPQCRLEETGE